jgi:threonine dehydratase
MTVVETAPAKETAQTVTQYAALQHEVFGLLDEVTDATSWLHEAFYGAAGVTDQPLTPVPYRFAGNSPVWLLDETDHQVTIAERSQQTGTFKRRGALLAGLLAVRRDPDIDGFVTASAGNHALGVAAVAQALGKTAHIYCSESISPVKKDKLERTFGAQVYPYNDTLETAMSAALGASEQRVVGGERLAFIHPFDQPEVIAGQATVGLRAIEKVGQLERAGAVDPLMVKKLVAGVGGGGLAAGLAIAVEWAEQRGMVSPGAMTVLGAQMEGCNAVERTLTLHRTGRQVPDRLFAPGELDTSCDGTAVQAGGALALAALRNATPIEGVASTSKAAVGAAMRDIAGVLHSRVEPAGALAWSLAKEDAVIRRDAGLASALYLPVVSGANVTPERYAEYQAADAACYRARLDALAYRSAVHVTRRRSSSGLAVIGGAPKR